MAGRKNIALYLLGDYQGYPEALVPRIGSWRELGRGMMVSKYFGFRGDSVEVCSFGRDNASSSLGRIGYAKVNFGEYQKAIVAAQKGDNSKAQVLRERVRASH